MGGSSERKATLRSTIARLGGVVAAGTALVLGLAACGSGTEEASPTGAQNGDGATTLKIGFMGDLTGANSALMIPPSQGAQLAVDEFNAKSTNVKVEMVKYDSQGNPDQAVTQVQQAITQDKITALVGPGFSGESRNVGPILEQAKIPSISASATNPALADNGWKFWHRVVANDDVQGPAVAEFLVKAKSAKKAFVIDDAQEYGAGLGDAVAKGFESQGVKVERDKIDPEGSDYSSTVTKVKAAAPDVIFFGGYYAPLGRLLKQLRDGGVKAVVSSGDGSVDKALVEGAGKDAAEGAVLGCPCLIPFGSDVPELKTFSDNYKAKFGADPLIYATEGYDAMSAFLKAIEAGNTTSEKINEYLSTIDFPGVSKQIKFNPNGEIAASVIHIYEVKDGNVTWLGDTSKAQLS
ncbi:branched-chain amino acid ABC transporter substrate-binding protein [Microtetraspora malaysiensis]|uniref:branched-chain amino acid ABC transporter substrate-binding protein n=1 Tax=Microtetraspora malaysiensis TaxID=161358 RepID=UPI003D8E1399